MSTKPPGFSPENTSTWCSSVASWTTMASGATTGSRMRMGWSAIRQNATTGAPVRSEPKDGKACAWRPSSKAAMDNSSAAVTTPCPPRPWIRTSNMV